MSFDVQNIRAQFPILSREINGTPLAYLDNAASAQKPQAVIDALSHQMSHSFANVHRGLHTMANETTAAFEGARAKVAKFLGAPKPDRHFLRERYGAVIKFIPVTEQGELDLVAYRAMLGPKTKIVSIVHMSNVLGTINPVKEMGEWAHAAGAIFIVDGTQAAVHIGHKLYGPTGIGALYGKIEILERMQPFQGGGEMIADVYEDRVTYNDPPHKFEAGTPPILEAIGLGAAIDWYTQFDPKEVHQHEMAVYYHALDGLRSINSFTLIGDAKDKGSVLAFNLKGAHAHDVAQILDKYGIAVRAGQHCTQPLMTQMGIRRRLLFYLRKVTI